MYRNNFKALPKKNIPTPSFDYNTPESWDRIIQKLRVFFPSYTDFSVAGGAIRDYIHNLPPHDIDIFVTLPEGMAIPLEFDIAVFNFGKIKDVEKVEGQPEGGRHPISTYDQKLDVFEIPGSVFNIPVPVQVIFQNNFVELDIKGIVSNFYSPVVKGYYNGRVEVLNTRAAEANILSPLPDIVNSIKRNTNYKTINWALRNTFLVSEVNNPETRGSSSLNGISTKDLLKKYEQRFLYRYDTGAGNLSSWMVGHLAAGLQMIEEYILFPKEV